MKITNTGKVIFVLFIVTICSSCITGCNNNGNSGAAGNSAKSYETYDAGNISTVVPDGWEVSTSNNLDGDIDQNRFSIYKGGNGSSSLHKPGVMLAYYGPKTRYISGRGVYDDVVEQDPVTIGGREWSYFTFTSLG